MSDSLSTAWAARKAARGAHRACNPETEFTAGHASRDAEVAQLLWQRQTWISDANRQVQEAEDAADALPGFWFGRVADERNPDDEGTTLLDPVVVFAEDGDDALTKVQDKAHEAIPDAEYIGYPVTLRRATLAEVELWLAEHDREVKAEALEEFAAILRERYPEDVFRPLSDADHKSANDALAGRSERTHVTRDRMSADMMRRAASQSTELAAEIRKAT